MIDPLQLGLSAGTDYFAMDELLTEGERAVRDRVREFCDREVVPVIGDYVDRAEFPIDLARRLATLGIVGGTITGYGCPGLTTVGDSMVRMELARGDGSIVTFFGVHSGLAMQAIYLLGSEEQKDRWLPSMARLEKIGAFALTEPEHGSDVVRLETTARRDGDEYILDGTKRWIGNGTIADVVVVWARDESGEVGGFLVEPDTPGYRATLMTGKASKRAVWQAEIVLDGLRVPSSARLPQASSFRDTTRVLSATRYGVGWTAIGHATAAYEAAFRYTMAREQFGRPLASYQMIQCKLATMLAEITNMQFLALRLTRLAGEGRMTDGMASLAKMHTARCARRVVSEAREMLGGNGILIDHHVARHWMDMEAVYTYEGTDTIQALIVGREITGHRAFS
jgi:glutaryl-CoA dehydrogenase